MKNQSKYHILVIGGIVAFRLFICRNRQIKITTGKREKKDSEP
jgi:hypothetical protein